MDKLIPSGAGTEVGIVPAGPPIKAILAGEGSVKDIPGIEMLMVIGSDTDIAIGIVAGIEPDSIEVWHPGVPVGVGWWFPAVDEVRFCEI